MPVLSNTRHERFAQELVKGASASEAYKKAGYKADDANASRLTGNDKVKARIAELNEKAAEKVGVTKERIIAELAKIGFANMLDYISVDTGGQAYVDLKDLDRDKAAAIGEITSETYDERDPDGDEDDRRVVKKVKFKLLDKRLALVDLGRDLGMFKDESGGTTVIVGISDKPITAEQWARKHGGIIDDAGG